MDNAGTEIRSMIKKLERVDDSFEVASIFEVLHRIADFIEEHEEQGVTPASDVPVFIPDARRETGIG